jgi:uncharacterized protein YebE (UPF0316 family)
MVESLFGGPWGPLLIFGLRICDVSLALLRTLLAVRNVRVAVPVIGFFEVLIWIFAVGAAIDNLNSPWHLLGYAGGFAMGNVVGMWIEGKLAFGLAIVRVISKHGGVEVAEALREKGFGVTEFAGHGRDGTVEILDSVVKRRHIPEVLKIVDLWDPGAFVMIEEPRLIRHGWLHSRPAERVAAPFAWKTRGELLAERQPAAAENHADGHSDSRTDISTERV